MSRAEASSMIEHRTLAASGGLRGVVPPKGEAG